MKRTQCERMLELLEDGGWHSTIESIELGILRPPSRADDFRRQGFPIEVRRVTRPHRSVIYEYRLRPARPVSAIDLASVDASPSLVATDSTTGAQASRARTACKQADPEDLNPAGRQRPTSEPWLVTCPTCRAPKRATAKAGLVYLACGHFIHGDELERLAADGRARRAAV